MYDVHVEVEILIMKAFKIGSGYFAISDLNILIQTGFMPLR